jgi:anti-sigma factor RsiW
MRREARRHLSQAALHELLEGTLEPAQLAVAAAHLEACRLCRRRADHLRPVFESLRRLPEARLQRDLTEQVLSRVPGRRTPVGLRWALGLELAAALGLALAKSAVSWQAWFGDVVVRFGSLLSSFVAGLRLAWINLELLWEHARSSALLVPSWVSQPAGPSWDSGLGQLGLAAAAVMWLAGNTILLPVRPRKPADSRSPDKGAK